MLDTNRLVDDRDFMTEPHHVRYDPTDSTNITESIAIAIAELEGVHPLELDPLYGAVNPESLEKFVAHGGSDEFGGEMSLTFEGYSVTVHASGLVEIERIDV
ncbi:HalOD1 output domain-containing protein [Halorussus halophilus]|uniref:HalOD1 output domain-containing protein n=1 Tax=Halorussus halophilus TaxID=2650975 RepID=UPI001301952F|nr:HalOD1 output domain-containing protein [Halorussus halophilus]